MNQQYAALEKWIARNTIIYDEGTDLEEHRWAPGAEAAITLLCNNLLSTGIADIAVGVKKCRTCRAVKPTSMFSKNLRHKDLLQSDCKACNKAARAQ